MNRSFRLAICLLPVLVFSRRIPLGAQPAGGPLPPAPDFSGGQVISSVPYSGGGFPIDSGIGQPIQGQIIQGAPIQGQIIGDPIPAGGNFGSISSTVIPYDSPILSEFGVDSSQAYGPNNPPPVVDFTLRNRRDNGVVKAQEVPAPSVLLEDLTRQLEAWSPQGVLLDELTPTTVMKMTVPYGVDTQFLCRTGSNQTVPRNGQVQVQAQTEPAYAVGILCWNLPIGVRRIFNSSEGLLVPRIGFGYQQTRGELLASLAMANVSSSYEIKANPDRRMTVGDLMESEMKEMTLQEDLSMMAIGLSFYLDDFNRTWQDAAGETVSLVTLAESELARPVYWARSESVNRLLGLTYLSDRFHRELKNGGDPRLQSLTDRIDENLKTVHQRSLEGLNDAGLMQTRFLSGKKISSAADILLVNGHFLRWHLVNSARFPINSQSLRKSIYHLALTLAQFYNPRTEQLRNYSPREIEAISVTLHALRLYVKKYTKEPESTEPDTDTASE
ncbi:MAG: hypothetical protein J6S40_09725 [Thermoguttaceae bacterium]|nr:hypothetical protein [Thermoguttaceae bacterium]